MIDINLNDGENNFNFSEFEDYDSLLKAILSTVEEEKDIIRDYTISLIGYDYDIDFYRVKDLETLFNWYLDINEYEDYEKEAILAYNDLYGFSTNMDKPLDELFGKYTCDYDAAYTLLTEYMDFNRDQAIYVLDRLDCVDKIIEGNFDIINEMYFWK